MDKLTLLDELLDTQLLCFVKDNSEGPCLVEEELFPTTPGPAPETTPMPTTPGPEPETTPMPPSDSPALDEDNLFIAAIQQYENSQGSKKQNSRPFAKPVSTSEITKAMQDAVPQTTQKDTRYCVRMWDEWTEQRNKLMGTSIPPLNELPDNELEHLLCCFILELRKKDGSEFPPNSLHHICCGIMRFIRENGRAELDIFKDKNFSQFRKVLDSEMKRLQAAGIGSVQKKAEPITYEEEEILWEKGILGDGNPQALLNTMFYMNGLYFALRGGREHRNLRHQPSQIQLVEKPG